MSIAVLESEGIEDYTNYLGEYLYSSNLVIKDKNGLEENEKIIKLIFTDYLEKFVLKQALKDNGLTNIENIKDIQFLKKYSNGIYETLEESEIKSRNMFVYDYFKLTKEEWDRLENITHSGICYLMELLEDKFPNKGFENLYVWRMKIDIIVKLIKENISEVQDQEQQNYLNEFLKLSTKKQKLIMKGISDW